MAYEDVNAFIVITEYRWAGRWGPFKVTIPCGECNLTKGIIEDVAENDLKNIPVKVVVKDWLSNWWEPFWRGGWHAPIVMVNNRVISQGKAINRGLLIEAVMEAYAKIFPIQGNHIFGKDSCPYCQKAKKLLEEQKVKFTYHEVVKNPKALYEMIARVKPLIPAKQPLTVPQIWLDGKYIGGCDDLEEFLHKKD